MIARAGIKDKDGLVAVGLRHSHISITGEDGFVTDTGEFLNRQDALKHAIECGQVSSDTTHLISDKLW